VRVNVEGALMLLRLAEESSVFECFAQVSTSFVNSDRTGFVEERIYEAKHDWTVEFGKILAMSQREVKENEKKIMGTFPNSFCYSKRMAEHLLL
jgi:fatty acyl-CoA reductase